MTYFIGSDCGKGHGGKRYIVSGKCVGCQAVMQRRRREDPKCIANDAVRYRLKKKRREAEMRVPKWADHKKIKAIYEEARVKGMVVDHYYPLRGLLVTGLHVAENLRIVTYEENAIKSNKMPDDGF